jgi:lysozyme
MLNVVVDLSHFNTVTSFPAANGEGILGVIHKATEGRNFVDPNYDERRPQALVAGLLWGAYHFGTHGDVEGQVNHFLEVVNPEPDTLLVLDFEPNPHAATMTLAEAEEFVQRVQERIGRFPGLYSGEFFLGQELGDNTTTVLKNCFLWIAKFSADLPKVPPAFQTFTLLQYTNGAKGPHPHRVSGIGRCDRDKFNGDEAGLRRLWGVVE